MDVGVLRLLAFVFSLISMIHDDVSKMFLQKEFGYVSLLNRTGLVLTLYPTVHPCLHRAPHFFSTPTRIHTPYTYTYHIKEYRHQ